MQLNQNKISIQVSKHNIEEQLDILRRCCDTGLAHRENNGIDSLLDMFIHMKNEIYITKKF